MTSAPHAPADGKVDTANLTREEAAERARTLRTQSYAVELDVASGDETFRSRSTISFTATPGATTFVDVQAVSIESATLNGAELDVSGFDGNRLAVPGLAQDNELVVEATMRYSHTGEGLHRTVDPVDDEVYLYSQFEVPDARRMYANFEQPDLKATFAFTVLAPENWLVLSNSPTPEAHPVEGRPGVARWEFSPTDRISTYLTALVAGPYQGSTGELTSSDGRTIPLGVYCRASLVEHLDAEEIMDITRRGFAFYEDAFATPYPFAKYDQIFVPDFNMGAMENVGCVTYRDSYVFRSKVTGAMEERRAVTILHELAHMWFGNLVTMQWWNDLWLNESFAEFTSSLATADATRWTDAWVTFSAMEKAWATRQDQMPSTHPVVAPVRDLDDVAVNFDGITYAKGASVLRQLVAYVGREEFFAALRTYFDKHAWGNTVLADLLTELETASGRDLSPWSTVWLEEAGLTVLRAEVTSDETGKIDSFDVVQTPRTGAESLRPHRLRIGAYDMVEQDPADAAGARPRLERVDLIEMDVDGERTTVEEWIGRARPALLLVNDEDLTYAKIRLDDVSWRTAMAHIADVTDAHARALLLGIAWDMVRDGEWAATPYLDMALRAVPAEDQSTGLRILLANIATAVDHYVSPDARDGVRADVAERLFDLTDAAEAGSDAQLQLSRAAATHATSDAQLTRVAGWLDGVDVPRGLAVDRGQRWVLVQALAAKDAYDESQIAAELSQDDTQQGRLEADHARAARPTPEAKQAAWDALTTDHSLANSRVENLLLGFARNADRMITEPFARAYGEAIDEVWQARHGEVALNLVEGLFPIWLAGREPGVGFDVLDAAQEWLDSHEEAPAGQRRLVVERLDEARRIRRAQEADLALREEKIEN